MEFKTFINHLREYGFAIVSMNEYTTTDRKMYLYCAIKKIGDNICYVAEGTEYNQVFKTLIAEVITNKIIN